MRELTIAAASVDAHGPESLRRSNLYGVSSPKRLPRVRLQPADARVRRDLAAVLLAANGGGEGPQLLEDGLRNRKHREDQGLRPPMDLIQRLQDLHTTVPKDLVDRDGHSSDRKREWRVGYRNHAHGTSRGPINGMFEPFDAVREVVRDAADEQMVTSQSVAIAYPVARASPAKIAAELQPFDEEAAREEMERRTGVRRNQESAEDAHWCPASYSTIHEKRKPKRSGNTSTGTLARDTAGSQPFPVRKVSGIGNPDAPPPRARKTPLATDERCVQKKQSLLAKAAASYARIRQRVDRSKDPKLRYALPVEDPSKQRAYRLGLEPVPSSDGNSSGNNSSLPPSCSPTSTPSRERLRFRPRSAAGVSAPFRSLASSSSQSSLSSLAPAPSVGKVAGAKHRPHSASVCYLGSSTVYCVDASSSHRSQQQQQHIRGDELAGSDFDSVLDRERHKRRSNQNDTLALLSRRGMCHNLPVPQIFARLRRESLKNLTRRLQRAQYEKMSLEEYMSSCGMLAIVNAERKESSFQVDPTAQVGEVPSRDADGGGGTSKSSAHHPPPAESTSSVLADVRSAATTSSSLLAMRRVLVVTRQQFHIALEAFNLSPADVNLLFSALDVGVEDRVALWEILCAVEKLQDGHAELRRSRVQIKARDLPKDLDLLRQSFRIPNVTHAPLELPEARDESS